MPINKHFTVKNCVIKSLFVRFLTNFSLKKRRISPHRTKKWIISALVFAHPLTKNRSASIAALQPPAAAVTACL